MDLSELMKLHLKSGCFSYESHQSCLKIGNQRDDIGGE